LPLGNPPKFLFLKPNPLTDAMMTSVSTKKEIFFNLLPPPANKSVCESESYEPGSRRGNRKVWERQDQHSPVAQSKQAI
jgi:hypothetical protein